MESIELILTGGGGAVASFIANQALTKYRLTKVEQDLEKGLQAVKIAKNSKFKEIREDYKEREQILHKRIDRTRDDNNKKFEEINKQINENNNNLNGKIDDGFKAINQRLDTFIQNFNK